MEEITEKLTVEILQNKLELLGKFRNQISVYSGRRDGGLATLQDLVWKLKDGKKDTIICEYCQKKVWEVGHADDCEIAKNYDKAFGLGLPDNKPNEG